MGILSVPVLSFDASSQLHGTGCFFQWEKFISNIVLPNSWENVGSVTHEGGGRWLSGMVRAAQWLCCSSLRTPEEKVENENFEELVSHVLCILKLEWDEFISQQQLNKPNSLKQRVLYSSAIAVFVCEGELLMREHCPWICGAASRLNCLFIHVTR